MHEKKPDMEGIHSESKGKGKEHETDTVCTTPEAQGAVDQSPHSQENLVEHQPQGVEPQMVEPQLTKLMNLQRHNLSPSSPSNNNQESSTAMAGYRNYPEMGMLGEVPTDLGGDSTAEIAANSPRYRRKSSTAKDGVHDITAEKLQAMAPAQLYSTMSGRLFHSGRIAIVLVGPPARGKT